MRFYKICLHSRAANRIWICQTHIKRLLFTFFLIQGGTWSCWSICQKFISWWLDLLQVPDVKPTISSSTCFLIQEIIPPRMIPVVISCCAIFICILTQWISFNLWATVWQITVYKNCAKNKMQNQPIAMGLEPTISRSGGERLIH